MDISSFLEIAGLVKGIRARSSKQALKSLAAAAASLAEVNEREVHRKLFSCEKGTGAWLGGGVCIRHVHAEGVARVRGVCVLLAEPVDFNAEDAQKVDAIFLLLSPLEATPDSLKALALVTRSLRDPARRRALREAEDADSVTALLEGAARDHAA